MINGELQCIPGIWSASDKPGVPLGATDSKTGSEIFFYQGRRCIGVDKKPSMGCLTCFFWKEGGHPYKVQVQNP